MTKKPEMSPDRITLENVEQVYRNYAGEERKPFNAAGKRNFCAFVSDEWAEQLAAWGYNVKFTKPRDEYEKPRGYIKVNVNFNSKFPPKIIILTGNKMLRLDADTVDMLDFAEIESTDITITPHHWSEDDPHRASAYLKTAYIRVIQDELDAKYLDDGPDGEEELEVEMHL